MKSHLSSHLSSTFATLALALVFSAAGPARADEAAPSAIVKAAAAIENRLPAGESATFKAGERVFVWSEVKDAAGKTVEHVWKRDGREVSHARLPVGGKVWKTNSRTPRAQAGSYVVEVVVDGKVLGSVSFKVE